jgi:hypothetical protein
MNADQQFTGLYVFTNAPKLIISGRVFQCSGCSVESDTSFLQHNMAGHLFAALLIAVHSFSPAVASDFPSTITIAPEARQTPYYDLAKRQAFTTYETTSPLPLTRYHYPFDDLPPKINPFQIARGPQFGINQCNSSTEGPNSICQTIQMNNIVCSVQFLVILNRV